MAKRRDQSSDAIRQGTTTCVVNGDGYDFRTDPVYLNHPQRDKFPDLARQWAEKQHAARITAKRTNDRQPGDDADSEGASSEDASEFTLSLIESSEYFSQFRKHEFLIRRTLVKGEPAVLGGPHKSLKTEVALDLAISLASGSKFLGEFDVYRPKRVAFLSGESGQTSIEQAARRICTAKELDPRTLNMAWGFKLPQLANATHLAEVTRAIRGYAIDVLCLDPLYLCLLNGVSDISAANLYQIGPLLLSIADACLEAGATPILLHHSNKKVEKYQPMQLGDLSFAGISEFARQRLLLNHREPFDPETGTARLHLNVGGSAGQGGAWYVDICGGRLDENGAGRTWQTTVTTASEGIQATQRDSEARRAAAVNERTKANDARFLKALDWLSGRGQSPTIATIRARAGLGNEAAKDCATRLTDDGIIESVAVTIQSGTNSKVGRTCIGYQRTERLLD